MRLNGLCTRRYHHQINGLKQMMMTRQLSAASASTWKVENLLIVGAGFMGSGIAQTCAIPGRLQSITIQDKSTEQLERAKENIFANLVRLKDKKRVPISDPEVIASRIHLSTATKPVGSDRNLLVIEAISEVLEWKQQLFQELTTQFDGNNSVIFVSNTSSLRCTDIGAHLPAPVKGRFAGLHFLDAIMSPLVEVARTEGTAEATLATLKQFAVDIDKTAIICKDIEGFIANRLQIPLLREALRMVERGDATVEDIDKVMKLGYQNPMGPFELLDYIGLDVIKLVMDSWTPTDHNGKLSSSAIESLINAGHLGRKTGKGFYDYSSKKKAKK